MAHLYNLAQFLDCHIFNILFEPEPAERKRSKVVTKIVSTNVISFSVDTNGKLCLEQLDKFQCCSVFLRNLKKRVSKVVTNNVSNNVISFSMDTNGKLCLEPFDQLKCGSVFLGNLN